VSLSRSKSALGRALRATDTLVSRVVPAYAQALEVASKAAEALSGDLVIAKTANTLLTHSARAIFAADAAYRAAVLAEAKAAREAEVVRRRRDRAASKVQRWWRGILSAAADRDHQAQLARREAEQNALKRSAQEDSLAAATLMLKRGAEEVLRAIGPSGLSGFFLSDPSSSWAEHKAKIGLGRAAAVQKLQSRVTGAGLAGRKSSSGFGNSSFSGSVYNAGSSAAGADAASVASSGSKASASGASRRSTLANNSTTAEVNPLMLAMSKR
jgi:hypothetical protein